MVRSAPRAHEPVQMERTGRSRAPRPFGVETKYVSANLPNLISIGRLLSVPLAVWLILSDKILAAFWLFVAAAVSDAVDGYIAKRFNARTVFGAYLDPLADKALLVSVYVTLGNLGIVEAWLVILVVFRDALIIGGAILFQTVTRALRMQPMMVSKVNTAAQLIYAAWVLSMNGFGLDDHGIGTGMAYVVATTTIISGAAYLVIWTRRAADMENGT